MIVAKRKELAEILRMIEPYDKVAIVGCNTCMAVCSAGGQEEVDQLAGELLAGRKDLHVERTTVPRQCSEKFIDRLTDKVRPFKAILSMACGNGVQAVASQFPDTHVLPALNTRFIGIKEKTGVWTEMCMACGNCILWRTAGICPVTRCAKGLLNGPCGGSKGGKCEVSKDIPCAWQQIYLSLKRLNLLHYLKNEPVQAMIVIHPDRIAVDEAKPQQLIQT